MPEQTVDLWAPDLVGGQLVTPVSILRQQASLLGPKTSNLLEGEVFTSIDRSSKRTFVHRFAIAAPTLDNYRYELFHIVHGLELYPVWATFLGESKQLNSQEELVDWLREVLSSEEVRRVVNALLAQSRS